MPNPSPVRRATLIVAVLLPLVVAGCHEVGGPFGPAAPRRDGTVAPTMLDAPADRVAITQLLDVVVSDGAEMYEP